MKNIYYLGISISHNSSAAIMKNGEIIVAVQEERFVRVKNYFGYPKKSIDYCLSKLNIAAEDLNYVAYTTSNMPGIEVKYKRTMNFTMKDWHDYYGDKYFGRKLRGDDCTDYNHWLRDDPKFNNETEYFDFSYLEGNDEAILDRSKDIQLFREEQIRCVSDHIGIEKNKVKFLDHHSCHAYYAYFGSPFRNKDCIAITLDGWGDGRNLTVWKVTNNEFELLSESTENDLGRLYKITTLLLGMKPNEHEFKVMGLAAYAKEKYVFDAMEIIKDLCEVKDMKIISKKRPNDLYEYLRSEWKAYRFDNIAGALQKYVEITASDLVRDVIKHTGINRLVLSGGISMNIKMNKVISEIEGVNEFFVCGSGADESLSMGGCYLLNKDQSYKNKKLTNLYLGYDISDEFYDFDFKPYEEDFHVEYDVSIKRVALLLTDGDIVAVSRRCAEFGARALGNRSILANPSIYESVKKINEAIKNRDFWMPFALSILSEEAENYIVNPKGFDSPHMTMSFDTKEDNYMKIKAGTHAYDMTIRPQMVRKETCPHYHELISEFFNITGIPALLNTSFNLHGKPIVNDINDAIETFRNSGLDHLFINDKVLISKIKKFL